MKYQSITNLKGEIAFRKKLFQQQVEGKLIFEDEFDTNGIENILSDRINNTLNQMQLLKDNETVLSPYLEIGAERCQRSLVMENDIGAHGAATDISFDMLKSCDYYKRVFNKANIPLRICCDINKLPFLSNSIPFIFCYETLHHFPDPSPIVKEINRVLSHGGIFFFDEEPFRRILHIGLFKSDNIYSKKSLNTGIFRKIFNSFFCEYKCNEKEHGIIENQDISVRKWKETFNLFNKNNIKLKLQRAWDCNIFNSNKFIEYHFSYLFGRYIYGICRKKGDHIYNETNIHNLLICPACINIGLESKLYQQNNSFFCKECKSTFPIVDGIVFLLEYGKFKVLYPEIFKKIF